MKPIKPITKRQVRTVESPVECNQCGGWAKFTTYWALGDQTLKMYDCPKCKTTLTRE